MEQSKDEKDSWEYPCRVVKGVLQKRHAVRAVERSSLREVTIEDASRMTWGVLRIPPHARFGGSTLAWASKDVYFLFQNRLTTKNLDAVEVKVNKIQKDDG